MMTVTVQSYRMVMLNDWMGALLQAFPIMPPVAQVSELVSW